jgi:hypothetical protein
MPTYILQKIKQLLCIIIPSGDEALVPVGTAKNSHNLFADAAYVHIDDNVDNRLWESLVLWDGLDLWQVKAENGILASINLEDSDVLLRTERNLMRHVMTSQLFQRSIRVRKSSNALFMCHNLASGSKRNKKIITCCRISEDKQVRSK